MGNTSVLRGPQLAHLGDEVFDLLWNERHLRACAHWAVPRSEPGGLGRAERPLGLEAADRIRGTMAAVGAAFQLLSAAVNLTGSWSSFLPRLPEFLVL